MSEREFDVDKLERKDMVTVAKAWVEYLVEDLEGDDDFLPFLMIQPKGVDFDTGKWHMLAMVMPKEAEAKNKIANYMTAACALYNAEEVVFGSAGWVVENPCKEELEMPPSDSPMRMEKAFIAHSTSVTGPIIGHHSCAIVRKNGKVELGEWKDYVGIMAQGRFAEAIALGCKLAGLMPPELRQMCDERVAEGGDEMLLASMAQTIEECRETMLKKLRGEVEDE